MKMMRKVAAVLALLSCLVATASAEPAPGPLEVKAYMPWTVPSARDPDSGAQRIYLRMRNNESGPIEVVRIEGTFVDASGNALFTDLPTCPSIPAGEGRELYLRFINTGMLNHLGCKILVRYKLGAVTYERRAFVNQEHPGFPEGYDPAQP